MERGLGKGEEMRRIRIRKGDEGRNSCRIGRTSSGKKGTSDFGEGEEGERRVEEFRG